MDAKILQAECVSSIKKNNGHQRMTYFTRKLAMETSPILMLRKINLDIIRTGKTTTPCIACAAMVVLSAPCKNQTRRVDEYALLLCVCTASAST